ncbi:MAG: Asp-tRNA(Asn)/Glu-tRNA(Gln) amidotransferase subunit GatB [Oligoflexia bacterium]|nr:Asp-tRNA(Asn)/Glu-tRNA(Gln) amidotransferase subunit GatB [Oligoflexia bacterium]
MHPEFEAVIGLEVHAQLSTQSKIFCGCRARLADGTSVADAAVNSNTCPVCAGHPGALPVLNRRVVEYALRAGLATNCRIRTTNVFARKNYFYPDLPKGYQLSQYEEPICEGGYLDVAVSETETKRVRLQRIHMEEDAGKSVHFPGYSLVNLNRAGVPLIEIVSAPDLSTPAEAGAYLRSLHAIVTALGICDGNMQEGNFRCDANVSVRPRGARELGTRTEIKNVNSFRFVEKAIEYEIARQIQLVKGGGKVVQETRTYDSDRNLTLSMRSKEEAEDYRYFPDPDLLPVLLEEAWIEEIRRGLPELPEQKKARFIRDFGIAPADAAILVGSRELADFCEATIAELSRSGMEPRAAGKPAANWLVGELRRLANEQGLEVSQSCLTPGHLADVVRLTQEQVISGQGAKTVIAEAWRTGETIASIVDAQGLRQVSDTGALVPAIDKVIAANPKQVAEFKAGKEKLLGFFVGQVMKETGGKANPALVGDLVRKRLK